MGAITKSVWKYVLFEHWADVRDDAMVLMPPGSQVLSCAIQGEALCVWALVTLPETGYKPEPHFFRVAGTGHGIYMDQPTDFPQEGDVLVSYNHLATILTFHDSLVLHVFEIVKEEVRNVRLGYTEI